ncbi:MAG: hypothetical protein U0457_18420 [Candidatus Sericytochromatia bacterium]
MEKKVTVENINKKQFDIFNITEEELVAFALDESALLEENTLINNLNARDLVKSFYQKRENFRQNTRLGHILTKEFNLSKETLIDALSYHEKTGVPLGEAFIALKICTQEQINTALEKQAKMRSYIR